MAINPPTPEQVAAAEGYTHASVVKITDVQAALLERYRAEVEDREPDFTGIPQGAVDATEPKNYVPGEELPERADGPVKQLPINNESGQVNHPFTDHVNHGQDKTPRSEQE